MSEEISRMRLRWRGSPQTGRSGPWRNSIIACLGAATALALPPFRADAAPPIPSSFQSRGSDREEIMALLKDYTRAVSNKDEALFESLLLNKSIPFSSVGTAVKAGGTQGGTSNYDSFRRSVFEGAPFTQRFRNIHIEQDGALADVSLIFVNTTAHESSWGWKALQLLKVDGHWKIASEFFTAH